MASHEFTIFYDSVGNPFITIFQEGRYKAYGLDNNMNLLEYNPSTKDKLFSGINNLHRIIPDFTGKHSCLCDLLPDIFF